jgi:hypothetical protein
VNNFTEILIELIKQEIIIENEFVKEFFLQRLTKMNFFVNVMSLLVEELIFDMEPFKIALISLRTSILFLKSYELITTQIYDSICEIINQIFLLYGRKYYIDLEIAEDIFPISDCLVEAIIQQQNTTRKKSFYSLFYECLSSIDNNDYR